MTSSSVADSCSSVYAYNPNARYLENRNPSLPGEALRSRDCFSATASNGDRPWEMLSSHHLPEGTDPLDSNGPTPLLPPSLQNVPNPPQYLKNYQFGATTPATKDGHLPPTSKSDDDGVVKRGSITKFSKGFESSTGGDVTGELPPTEMRNPSRRDSRVVIIEASDSPEHPRKLTR